jgi:LysR family glycine cleavage system transcriptional activator
LQVATREKAWPFWLESMGLEASQFGDQTSYGHFFMTIQAAIEGKGVALVPHIFVENELKSGMLVQLFGGKGVQAGVYHFLCRESQWQNPKIERFREWLFKESGSAGLETKKRARLVNSDQL